MAGSSALNQQILEHVKALPEKDKREVLNFIEYLKIREDRAFIDYVNQRTQEAVEAKKRGERFTSLKELQRGCA